MRQGIYSQQWRKYLSLRLFFFFLSNSPLRNPYPRDRQTVQTAAYLPTGFLSDEMAAASAPETNHQELNYRPKKNTDRIWFQWLTLELTGGTRELTNMMNAFSKG